MKKLKKFNHIKEEIDIHETLPNDYLRDVERKGRQQYGNGPSRQEMGEMMQLMNQIFRLQRGHEDELTEIGLDILKKNYPILNDVILDAKIVKPDDEEKMKMVQKMLNNSDEDDDNSNDDNSSLEYGSKYEVDDVNMDEVSKRKIINNLMQGESQNVHSMMYESKPEVDSIAPGLIELHMRHLELNKKFDWWDQISLPISMQQMPEMTNAMETDYEGGDGEVEEIKPKIKARVLDLPMLIHEVVKGIYELIAANALPEDAVTAAKILRKTDTLVDEQQDIKFGPFIAADMRNYLNEKFENDMVKYQPDNIKELIYGKMMLLPTKTFIDVVKGMLINDKNDLNTYNILKDIVKEVVSELDKYSTDLRKKSIPIEDINDYDIDDSEDIEFMKKSLTKKDEPKKKENIKKELTDKDYINMSQGELNNLINTAIDDGDYELAQRISKFIKEK